MTEPTEKPEATANEAENMEVPARRRRNRHDEDDAGSTRRGLLIVVPLVAIGAALAYTALNGATKTRAQVVRSVVEDSEFVQSEFNKAFVLMQYFGYLRRDPDEAGFNFWLNKLNQFNGNFVAAEMVKAFITSGEYRQRFGQH